MSTEAASTGQRDDVTEALAELVRVLADGGSAAELDGVCRRLRSLPGVDRVMGERAMGHARQVAARLERRGRRMRELTALYETARELTSLRDVDAVLMSIVERVRRLLGTDSTYVALVDDSDGVVMRVTSGAVPGTPGHDAGSAVGSLVVRSGRPFATTNCRADPRVGTESGDVVSIVGAPMKLRQRVVGALLAANRHERTFDQQEIAVLSSLAHHAAVVIENARLFDEVRRAVGQFRDVHAQLSARRRELEVMDAAHEALMPLALTQAGFDEFAAVLGGMFGGDVSVDLTADGVAAAEPPGSVRAHDNPNCVELRVGGQSYGKLVLDRPDPVTGAEARVLESAGQTATLLAVLGRQRSIVEQELRRELAEDLISATEPDWNRIRERADRLGVLAAGQPHAVVAVSSPAPLHSVLDAAARCATARGGTAGERSGRVVLVVPVPEAAVGDLARGVARELTAAVGRPVTAGAAGPTAPGPNIRALHREAARCHDVLTSLRRDGDGAAMSELGVLGSVIGTTRPERLEQLVDHVLGPLLEYDTRRGASLLETVRCYFAAGRSVPAAARALGVHSNTLYQRLERIDRVLGGRRWREPAGAVDIQVALQLHDAMAPAPDR